MSRYFFFGVVLSAAVLIGAACNTPSPLAPSATAAPSGSVSTATAIDDGTVTAKPPSKPDDGIPATTTPATAPTSGTMAVTGSVTLQYQRVSLIAQKLGQMGVGTYGDECKMFVRNVVLNATGVQVPSNRQITIGVQTIDSYAWQPSKYFDVVSQLQTVMPSALRQYDIVQAVIPGRSVKWAPHTFFITAITPTGITVKDSNYSGNRLVQVHSFTFSEMSRWYGYTVYRINGVS